MKYYFCVVGWRQKMGYDTLNHLAMKKSKYLTYEKGEVSVPQFCLAQLYTAAQKLFAQCMFYLEVEFLSVW